MTISTRVQDVRNRRPQAVIGQLAMSDHLTDVLTLINSDPQAAQVDTLVVNTATNLRVYDVEINSATVEFTADASATKAEIADGLAAAINAEPLVRGQVGAVSDGIDTITLTGEYPGVAFVVGTVDVQLTHASVSTAAEADAIPFGRLVVSGGYQTDEATQLGILAKTAAFTIQVDTLTVAYAAGEVYLIDIEIEGVRYKFAVNANTDTATTHADIVAAINARMPANSVLAAGASPNVSLTAEVAGKTFVTSIGTESLTVANLSIVHTTAGDDVNVLARGVSIYTTDEENLTEEGDDVVYPANAGVKAVSKGLIWVESAQTIANGDNVYVELGVAADNGQFYNTSSATRVLLTGAKWERDERSTQTDGIALLRVNL